MSVSEEEWRNHVTPALPPSAWTKGLDPRWNRVTMRCLATAPVDRPQDVREILAELQHEPMRKWPFVTAGALVLLLATVVGTVAPVRHWVQNLLWPPNVRLAILPYDGPKELAAVGSGALQDVAERVQQLPSGRRTLAVLPPSRLSEMQVHTPQQARDVLHATHALKVTVQLESTGMVAVQADVIELRSQLTVRTLSARYTPTDIDGLQRSLTGFVAMMFGLREPASEDQLSSAASEPYLKGLYLLNRDAHSFDEAIPQFQQAAELDPKSALPASGMALALVQKFQFAKQNIFLEQAKRWVQKAQSRNPDSVRVLLASGPGQRSQQSVSEGAGGIPANRRA